MLQIADLLLLRTCPSDRQMVSANTHIKQCIALPRDSSDIDRILIHYYSLKCSLDIAGLR